MDVEVEKSKLEKYLIPSNIESVKVPKVNRAMWDVFSQRRMRKHGRHFLCFYIFKYELPFLLV